MRASGARRRAEKAAHTKSSDWMRAVFHVPMFALNAVVS
jgi:hypothetical protein